MAGLKRAGQASGEVDWVGLGGAGGLGWVGCACKGACGWVTSDGVGLKEWTGWDEAGRKGAGQDISGQVIARQARS